MTYVVTESCIKCKYTDCVDVCPVDAFREGPNFLAIDPDECIDCTLCVVECPVEAIFAEDDVPEGQRSFIGLNAELSRHWKPIVVTKAPPPDADAWAQVNDKRHLLEPSEVQEPSTNRPDKGVLNMTRDPLLHPSPDSIYSFDARGVAKRFRHAAIFGALDSLKPGETMRFVNDHDPLPLLDQLRDRYAGRLDIRYLQREPGAIMIDFVRQ